MDNITLDWLVQKLRRHWLLFLTGVSLGLVIGIGLFAITPSKYKATARINVSPRYFQSPMMRDFLPETYDPGELRSEREAAIASALSPEFLRRLSETGPASEKNLENLRSQFEILRENATTFQVGAVANSAERAYDLCLALTEQILHSTRDSRIAFLESLRDSVASRIRSMKGSGTTTVTRQDLSLEIADLKSQRQRFIQNGFSDSHPEVQQLNRRLKDIQKLDQDASSQTVITRASRDTTAGTSAEIRDRLLQDLLSKLQMMEVVLNLEKQDGASYLTVINGPLMPTAPVAPKLPVYLAWSLILGIFAGTGMVLIRSRNDQVERKIQTSSVDFYQRRNPIEAEILERPRENSPPEAGA